MSSIRTKILQYVNMILTSLISALGVVGCTQQKSVLKTQHPDTTPQQGATIEQAQAFQEQPIMCMYGVPRAQYIVQGCVTDSNGQPLGKKQVLLKASYEQIHVITDENGIFTIKFDGFPIDEMSFEIDGKQYTEKVIYSNEPIDAWNRGTATIEVKIVLK